MVFVGRRGSGAVESDPLGDASGQAGPAAVPDHGFACPRLWSTLPHAEAPKRERKTEGSKGMSDQNKKTTPLSSALRLICTDFDGTLAGVEGQPIHTVFFERLVAWRKRGHLFWIVNTGRTYESLQEELIRRKTPLWPDWIVTLERQIWLVRNQRGIGWFEWNRKCELLHAQLFESVKPIWKLIEDYVARHTSGRLVEDAGSPLGIIASCEEEADEISAFMTPLLQNWPTLIAVR